MTISYKQFVENLYENENENDNDHNKILIAHGYTQKRSSKTSSEYTHPKNKHRVTVLHAPNQEHRTISHALGLNGPNPIYKNVKTAIKHGEKHLGKLPPPKSSTKVSSPRKMSDRQKFTEYQKRIWGQE